METCPLGPGLILVFLHELLCLQQLHRVLQEHAVNHHSMKDPGLAAPRPCHSSMHKNNLRVLYQTPMKLM